MPNDAKLGLVAGVGLVLLIAAIFFRRDPAQAGNEPHHVVVTATGNSTLPPLPKTEANLPPLPPPPLP